MVVQIAGQIVQYYLVKVYMFAEPELPVTEPNLNQTELAKKSHSISNLNFSNFMMGR